MPKTSSPRIKPSKVGAYQTIGQTSDGVTILKPKASASRPTALGKKLARLMAQWRAGASTTNGPTKSSSKKTSSPRVS